MFGGPTLQIILLEEYTVVQGIFCLMKETQCSRTQIYLQIHVYVMGKHLGKG